MWTAIHAALGEQSSDLTYDLFERAIGQRVVESDDLDWKQSLPGDQQPSKDGFAKDVAAMANTRGGVIVFGMADERGAGATNRIEPVENGESLRHRLRAMAASNIHPFIGGLVLMAIDAPSAPGTGLLVLSVPHSPDAPHVIGQQARLGVPIRDRAETSWMRERDLERAYRDRFDRQADEQTRLKEEVDDVRDRLDLKPRTLDRRYGGAS